MDHNANFVRLFEGLNKIMYLGYMAWSAIGIVHCSIKNVYDYLHVCMDLCTNVALFCGQECMNGL